MKVVRSSSPTQKIGLKRKNKRIRVKGSLFSKRKRELPATGPRNTNQSAVHPDTLQGRLLLLLTNENQSPRAAAAPTAAGYSKATNTRHQGILPPESPESCLAKNRRPGILPDPLLLRKTSLFPPGIRPESPSNNPFYLRFLISATGHDTPQGHHIPKKIKWPVRGTRRVTHSVSSFPFPDFSIKIRAPGIQRDHLIPKKTKWSAQGTPQGESSPPGKRA
jgi:hypothetical protein